MVQRQRHGVKSLKAEREVAKLKMLRFSSGATTMDRIRNEHIRRDG